MILPLKDKKIIYAFDMSSIYTNLELSGVANPYRSIELFVKDVMVGLGICVESFDYEQHELNDVVEKYKLNRGILRDQVYSLVYPYLTTISYYDDMNCSVKYTNSNLIITFTLKGKE